jgi:cysteine sulfinate desulfinase/cysteine desulfurase-like protein
VRVSIGWNTREADIDAFCAAWPAAYARVKERAA